MTSFIKFSFLKNGKCVSRTKKMHSSKLGRMFLKSILINVIKWLKIRLPRCKYWICQRYLMGAWKLNAWDKIWLFCLVNLLKRSTRMTQIVGWLIELCTKVKSLSHCAIITKSVIVWLPSTRNISMAFEISLKLRRMNRITRFVAVSRVTFSKRAKRLQF